MNKKFMIVSLFVLLVISAVPVPAQQNRSIEVGPLQYQASEYFSEDFLYWPRGTNEWDDDMMNSYGVNIGVKMNWTDANGVSWPHKIAQSADNRFSDPVNVVIPVPGAFKRTFRTQPPQHIVDGRDWTDVTYLMDPVNSSIPSDVMIYNHCNTWVGIDVKRWTYGFVNAEHENYVILEFQFKNVSGEDRVDVYFGLTAEMSTTSHYPGDLWGNYYGAGYAEYAAGDATKDDMRLWYAWDADDFATPTQDDGADPDQIWGNLEEPQFTGYMCLHADKSADDETDDPAQPHKAGWSQRELCPDLNVSDHNYIYQWLSEVWDPLIPNLYTYKNEGWYRTLWPTWDPKVDNPSNEQEKNGTFLFGPYQMKDGDDVRIVMAFVAGAISPRLAIDAGMAYDAGYSGLKPRVPMPYAVPGICNAGDLLTRDQKDAIWWLGKDIMFETARKAKQTWLASSINLGTGTFAVDNAPPSPSLTVTALPGKVMLEWESVANAAGYKVYRNYWRPPEKTDPVDTTFVLLVDAGTSTSYEDLDVIRGQDYYYIVTAYTAGGVESSKFHNRTGGLKSGVERLAESASPTRAPDEDWKNRVIVVPNPFHARGVYKYSGDKLNFLNLPSYCNIHVYTMTGDLVQTLEHRTGTGDQSWDRQDTFDTMGIISGIYLYVVEELDSSGSATGETVIGKFVVVK